MIDLSAHTDIEMRVALIDDGPDIPRRERETRAVLGLVREVFGPDAAIGHQPDGSPTLLCPTGYNISITHSRHFAGIAWSKTRPVGIDIEEADRVAQLLKIERRFMSPDDICDNLLQAWTLKEAAYKAIPGAPADMRLIRVAPDAVTCAGTSLDIHFSGALTIASHSLWISVVAG